MKLGSNYPNYTGKNKGNQMKLILQDVKKNRICKTLQELFKIKIETYLNPNLGT